MDDRPAAHPDRVRNDTPVAATMAVEFPDWRFR